MIGSHRIEKNYSDDSGSKVCLPKRKFYGCEVSKILGKPNVATICPRKIYLGNFSYPIPYCYDDKTFQGKLRVSTSLK